MEQTLNDQEYTHCPLCGSQLTEDGMHLLGRYIQSLTCRNKDCKMFDWTLNPEQHKQRCDSLAVQS